MKNPFRELEEKLLEVPVGMRKKVMHDIAIAKFIMEAAMLVTSNYSSLISGLLRTSKRS